MRRFVLVLLIALLPLQAVWAAAANACGHEHMSGKAHFGHHEHVHTAKVTAAADDVPDAGAADWSCGADCSTCHGHGWSAVLLDSPPALTQTGPGFVPSAYERFVAQRYLDNPLRPPLARLI
ncbi:hypothetical protein [Azohydromonas caseinilytica]|uniref:Cobalt-zinc-cadmium resistance protein CzcI n=1 Tax=Azohydromonas caseinilytica TaxID=2728836 RepID=A0A848FFQ1_9BURK|nr:hypothetical protein [Azohydromonas caseinilytica]NML17073.1 hypothetical protein [Azohydromonas caseinilytica]